VQSQESSSPEQVGGALAHMPNNGTSLSILRTPLHARKVLSI